MIQSNLFSDKICIWCKTNPGTHPNNPILWDGFIDSDNGILCCNNCKDNHYAVKQKVRLTYSETPVYAIN